MKIDITPHPSRPEITRLVLMGRLDTITEQEISPAVLKAMETCSSGLILDLAGVDFVSSAGLRLLLMTVKGCAERDVKVAMIRAQPSVYKIFKLAGFEGMFNLHQDDAAALETLWPSN